MLVLVGDVLFMDLGFFGLEVRWLFSEVEVIFYFVVVLICFMRVE